VNENTQAYFPAFLDLSSKEILVVGAGNVAARKIEKLLLFQNTKITVVAIEALEEVKELNANGKVMLIERAYSASDLDGKDIVIVAVDDIPLQKTIFDICQERKLLCNSVDSKDYCNFIFPALVVRGSVTVGISSGGQAPSLSARLRKAIDKMLPVNVHDIAEKISQLRNSDEVKAMPNFDQRAERVNQEADRLLDKTHLDV
jgi:precorrin-2 dehydrogenase/sirohydrochlorin ferrochelatase